MTTISLPHSRVHDYIILLLIVDHDAQHSEGDLEDQDDDAGEQDDDDDDDDEDEDDDDDDDDDIEDDEVSFYIKYFDNCVNLMLT